MRVAPLSFHFRCRPGARCFSLALTPLPARGPPPAAGWAQVAAGFLADLPLVRGFVRRQQAALAARVREGLRQKSAAQGVPPGLRALPRQGSAPNDVKRQLKYKEREDVRFSDGDSKVSGARVMGRPAGRRRRAMARRCRTTQGRAGWRRELRAPAAGAAPTSKRLTPPAAAARPQARCTWRARCTSSC